MALCGQWRRGIQLRFGTHNVRSANTLSRGQCGRNGTTYLKPCFKDRERVQYETHSNPHSRTGEQITLVSQPR